MGLEKVKEKVLADATQKADERIKSAQNEAKKLEQTARHETSKIEESLRLELSNEVNVIIKKEEAATKLEINKLVLNLKKELTDHAYHTASEKLVKLTERKRAKHIELLLKKATSEIKVAKIYCSKKDLKLLNDLNAEAAEISGGLIAETEDSTIRVDYSYETLLDQVRQETISAVTSILF